MAPRFPEELDVFTVPHTRMKHLVQMYLNQLSHTDFESESDLCRLLASLMDTFREFQLHEQIENQLIMDQLKSRLSAMSVYNSAVCNCHQDNRLTEMMEMLQNGLDGQVTRSSAGRILFRERLLQKLDDFTNNFLPHMREEEEIFQPLLVKYFGYDELRELKRHVLENHHLSEKADLPEKSEEADVAQCRPLPRLPSELLTHVFSFLTRGQRAAAAAVCRRWREAALAPTLWTHLQLTPTARGRNSSMSRDAVIEEFMVHAEGRGNKCWDADVDVDECETEDTHRASWINSPGNVDRHRRIIKSLTLHTLPLVGRYVRQLVLTGSGALSSALLRRLLVHCPNVRHLDVSYTNIGDCAFKRLPLGCLQRLEHLDLSGCERLTDTGLTRLAGQLDRGWAGLIQPTPASRQPQPLDIEDGGGGLPDSDGDCYDCESHERCSALDGAPETWRLRQMCRDKNGRLVVPPAGALGPRLTFLSLSGCVKVSACGLARLAASPALSGLRHLDLSGCCRLTAAGIHALVAAAPRLRPENLWYCDFIRDGPFPEQANSCDNLECPIRFCCRNK